MYKIILWRNGKVSEIAQMIEDNQLISTLNLYLNIYVDYGYRFTGGKSYALNPYRITNKNIAGYEYRFQKRSWLTVLDEVMIQVEKI